MLLLFNLQELTYLLGKNRMRINNRSNVDSLVAWLSNFKICTSNILFLFSIFLYSIQVNATEGGYSNYLPGTFGDFAVAAEPPTKLTMRNDTYYYQADAKKAVRAGKISIGADLTFKANITTLLYKPEIKIFGAQYAFGTLIPLAKFEIESSAQFTGNMNMGGVSDKADATGLGDIVFVPWVLFWNEGNWHTTFTQLVIAPTGNYDATAPINTSLNYWTFDTNVAATHLDPNTGLEFSFNIGHSYNTENSDTDYHSGREIHIDFGVNQFLSETFALGIQGYYWRQISDDKGDGALLGGFRGKSAGIGPAMMWATPIGGNTTTFIVKWLHEYDADNRLEGNHVMASFALSF